MTRAQGKHREFSLNQSVATLLFIQINHFCDVGYEISGRIDALCNTVVESKYKVGDRVIVYPEQEHSKEDGYLHL